jgi:hypothetical protein
MYNLEIQFSANIIKKVKSYNFQVDQLGSILFILFALYEENYALLDEFDDFNKQKRALLLYKDMELKGLLEQDFNSEKDTPHFNLTEEGVDLVEFIKGEFTQKKQQIDAETIAVSGVENLKDGIAEDDVENWIQEWIELFPRGVKSSSRLLRSDKPSCLRKMKVFLRDYGYDKDTIMKATKAYLDAKSLENYAYTRCAVYFIYKAESSRVDKVSDLATWCEQVLGDDKDKAENSSNNLEIMV